jgi:30S ribosomal protein S31
LATDQGSDSAKGRQSSATGQVPELFKFYPSTKSINMGRGDKKTKKGKIFKGSFGKSRPAKPAKKSAPPAAKGK